MTNSETSIDIMIKFAALSMGNRIKSSLKNRKPCSGSCKRMLNSQNPASSGTLIKIMYVSENSELCLRYIYPDLFV